MIIIFAIIIFFHFRCNSLYRELAAIVYTQRIVYIIWARYGDTAIHTMAHHLFVAASASNADPLSQQQKKAI